MLKRKDNDLSQNIDLVLKQMSEENKLIEQLNEIHEELKYELQHK